MASLLLLGTIVAPLVSVPILYTLGRSLREKTGYACFALLLIPLASILLAAALASGDASGSYLESYSWAPIGTFGLRADNLSIPVLFTISLLTAVIALFSVPYMQHKIGDEPERYGLYYSLYILYALGMVGTVLSTNLIQFYAFFEIMLIPSFFLIAEWGYGEREKISLMYFFWTHVGALVLLVGILVTAYLSGVTDMDVVRAFFTQIGIAGSIFQYVSHGTAKGILFIVAGAIILQVNGERSISKLGGLASKMPVTATAAFVGFLAILGLPTTNGFFSEFFLFQGSFIRAADSATLYRLVIAILSVIAPALSAGYSLWTLRRIFFGPTTEATAQAKEAPWTVTLPLIVLCVVTIFLGIYPEPILSRLVSAAKVVQGIGLL